MRTVRVRITGRVGSAPLFRHAASTNALSPLRLCPREPAKFETRRVSETEKKTAVFLCVPTQKSTYREAGLLLDLLKLEEVADAVVHAKTGGLWDCAAGGG